MKLQPSTEPGIPPQPKLPTITCMLDERTNLPSSIASSKPTKAGCGIHLCVTDDENQNLSHRPRKNSCAGTSVWDTWASERYKCCSEARPLENQT